MGVKEQKVELIELFYDLIYVYAISRLTELILEPGESASAVMNILRYFVLFFVILQAWLYLTNYVNRYGRWMWYDYLLTSVNMIAAVYLSNTINTAWEDNYVPFNIAMLVMLLSVVILYFIQTKVSDSPGAAENSIHILLIVCAMYLLGILFILLRHPEPVIWLDVAAVLVGAFLPFFLRGDFDKSIISFPHLAERFELLTIITFGEGVVGMADYFDIENFSLLPILVFALIITMFLSYVLQIHNLVKHERVERALRLMFSHYFIVIAVNILTIGIHILHENDAVSVSVRMMLIAAELLFYYAMMADKTYYHECFVRTRVQITFAVCGQILGAVVVLVSFGNVYGVITGLLVMSLAQFFSLLRTYHTAHRVS